MASNKRALQQLQFLLKQASDRKTKNYDQVQTSAEDSEQEWVSLIICLWGGKENSTGTIWNPWLEITHKRSPENQVSGTKYINC